MRFYHELSVQDAATAMLDWLAHNPKEKVLASKAVAEHAQRFGMAGIGKVFGKPTYCTTYSVHIKGKEPYKVGPEHQIVPNCYVTYEVWLEPTS